MEIIKKDNNTWIIEDSGVRCFLLEGNDKVALIDTGMNIENIKEVVSSLSNKPLMLLITHADRDHIGASSSFDEVYIGIHEMAFYGKNKFNQKVIPLYDKDVIDLGDRRLEVINLPGHTPGSVAFYDVDNGVLISGDPIQRNGRVFMFGEQRNLVAYISSLERLNKRKEDFKEIWPSHADLPIGNDSIEACIEDVKDLLDGKLTYELKENFGVTFRAYAGKYNTYLADNN